MVSEQAWINDQQRHPAQHPLHARPERTQVIEIARLADSSFVVERDDVRGFLRKEGEAGFLACSDAVLAHFRRPPDFE